MSNLKRVRYLECELQEARMKLLILDSLDGVARVVAEKLIAANGDFREIEKVVVMHIQALEYKNKCLQDEIDDYRGG